MTDYGAHFMIRRFKEQIRDKVFPCLGAHTALANNCIRFYVADQMSSAAKDEAILNFLYAFIDDVRQANDRFYSAVVLFRGPDIHQEDEFEDMMWKRLQAMSDMDSNVYGYDLRVDMDPASPHFSFSLKEEAFYIIGLHGASSRKARRFPYPALVFNAHVQFERLRAENHYEKMQQVIRKRDIRYSGSVNPMLSDFGETSEVIQYSGRAYDKDWKCPLVIRHARSKTEYHSTS